MLTAVHPSSLSPEVVRVELLIVYAHGVGVVVLT